MLQSPMKNLMLGAQYRFAICWKVTRQDGTVLSFTNHNQTLEIDGVSYAPEFSVNTSARQHQSGLQDQNAQLVGVVDSDDITFDDLRAGRYEDAKIEESLVDWLYPWQGVFASAIYYITQVQFDGLQWTAQITGLTMSLKQYIGDVFKKPCNAVLGDSRCTVDLSLMQVSGIVVDLLNTRHSFSTTITKVNDVTGAQINNVDDWFRFGNVTWTTGANKGLSNEVRQSLVTNGMIFLAIKTPFDIKGQTLGPYGDPVSYGDTFTITPGCDKQTGTCKTKFNNIINHRGFPWLPGTDKMLTTPDSHS